MPTQILTKISDVARNYDEARRKLNIFPTEAVFADTQDITAIIEEAMNLEKKVEWLEEDLIKLRDENEEYATAESTDAIIIEEESIIEQIPIAETPPTIESGTFRVADMEFDVSTARNAVVLSEIFGPPVSKTRYRWQKWP